MGDGKENEKVELPPQGASSDASETDDALKKAKHASPSASQPPAPKKEPGRSSDEPKKEPSQNTDEPKKEPAAREVPAAKKPAEAASSKDKPAQKKPKPAKPSGSMAGSEKPSASKPGSEKQSLEKGAVRKPSGKKRPSQRAKGSGSNSKGAPKKPPKKGTKKSKGKPKKKQPSFVAKAQELTQKLRKPSVTGSHSQEHPAMIRTLRIKFILINMFLAVAVMFASFGIACYIDYTSRLNAVYSELDTVLTDALTPRIPQIESVQNLKDGNADAVTNESASSSGNDKSAPGLAVPTIGSGANSNESLILVAVYNVSPNGRYTTLSTYTTASIPESVILRANETVMHSTRSEGYLDEFNLYYNRTDANKITGNYLIAYADGTTVDNWQNLALMLLFVGIAALVVFFLINIFFSRWALRPVEHSIKQQQQFTADASHELKTPLTVILANMAILKSEPKDTIGEQMQWVESTQKEAERMQLLVNDMLALSRPSNAQKPHVVRERVDFSDLVEGEVLQFESVAFELGVNIEDEISEGIFVMGDREKLGRMVATLIDNACKYADKDVRVKLRKPSQLTRIQGTGRVGQVAELTVQNDGPLISKEDLPHIFDRFYRADKARTSSKGGYGLGLAIGYQIAADHNGNITVSSSEGKGTVFTLILPLAD